MEYFNANVMRYRWVGLCRYFANLWRCQLLGPIISQFSPIVAVPKIISIAQCLRAAGQATQKRHYNRADWILGLYFLRPFSNWLHLKPRWRQNIRGAPHLATWSCFWISVWLKKCQTPHFGRKSPRTFVIRYEFWSSFEEGVGWQRGGNYFSFTLRRNEISGLTEQKKSFIKG